MSEEHEQGEALEPWLSLSNWEQQCIEEVESTPDMESEIQTEKDCAVQKLWFLFQNAATCIAQLYKDRQHGISLWIPFQNAASSVTTLYKECVESHKHLVDMGFQCGHQRRNKDLLAWAKKRKRHIRREDLISFLTGRNPPPQRTWNSPRQRLSLEGMRSPPHHVHSRLQSMESDSLLPHGSTETDFQTFRDALTLSGFNCAMPNGGSRQLAPGSCSPSSFCRGHRNRNCNQSTSSHSELSSYITEEFARHVDSRKRAPSTDVIMDSPTHKRSRLT